MSWVLVCAQVFAEGSRDRKMTPIMESLADQGFMVEIGYVLCACSCVCGLGAGLNDS